MPLPAVLPRSVRALAREEVYAQLSGWIIDGTLRPEEALRDQHIAEQLGVSRTPVREALRRLEDEGLVETAQNRWTRVATLNVTQAAELYPMVETLEDLALSLAFGRLDEADLSKLRQAHTALCDAVGRRDLPAAVAADTDFHEVWIIRSGNGELQQTLRTLKRKLRRIELAYFNLQSAGQASLDEHIDLLEALRRHDQAAAQLALRRNWWGSLQRLGQLTTPLLTRSDV